MSNGDTYKVTYDDGHSEMETLSELETLAETGMDNVQSIEPDSVMVHCPNCHEENEIHWSDLTSVLSSPCPECLRDEGDEVAMCIGPDYEKAAAGFKLHREQLGKLLRSRRPDYWDYVIHFCKYDAFISILRDGRLEARPTGLFKVPAVCMTDAPIHVASHFTSYGEYGLVFSKAAVLVAGGGPAVYLNDQVIEAQKKHGPPGTDGFSDALKPFVNVYRHKATAPKHASAKFVDFLHHREWRVPHDINLQDVEPEGLVLPEGTDVDRVLGPAWEHLLTAAYRYGTVRRTT